MSDIHNDFVYPKKEYEKIYGNDYEHFTYYRNIPWTHLL